MQIRDNVLVKEKGNTLEKIGVHRKLAHEHWTGPCKATGTLSLRLSYDRVLLQMEARFAIGGLQLPPIKCSICGRPTVHVFGGDFA